MKLFLIFFFLVALFGDDKVFIKGGSFIIPKGDSFYIKSFNKKIITIDDFYIDKYEFSYKLLPKKFQYLIPKYLVSSSFEDLNLPVMNISYSQALEICKLKGGDLPTEEEWIVAAAFENGKFYKYPTKKYPLDKNDINIKKNLSDGYIFSDMVFTNQALIGINGIYGMLGNVWEIVKSSGKYVLVKGGSFYNSFMIDLLDVRVRNYILKKDLNSRYTVGFRCVYRGKK